jgi:hypothetical protein
VPRSGAGRADPAYLLERGKVYAAAIVSVIAYEGYALGRS